MRALFIATDGNPCIRLTGSASVAQNQFCTWTTPNGATATIVVTNGSTTNELQVVISGAPPEVVATDGTPLNGQHSIPPNQPTANITGIANFKGQQVIVFNMSALPAPANIVAVGAGSC